MNSQISLFFVFSCLSLMACNEKTLSTEKSFTSLESLNSCPDSSVTTRVRYKNLQEMHSCQSEVQSRQCSDPTLPEWNGSYLHQSCEVIDPKLYSFQNHRNFKKKEWDNKDFVFFRSLEISRDGKVANSKEVFDQMYSEGLAFALESAVRYALPGDILVIREGFYSTGHLELSSIPGTEKSPVLLRSYPGEAVLIEGAITLGAHQWLWGLEIRGLERTQFSYAGITIPQPGVRVINCVVHNHWAANGISLWKAASPAIIYGNIVFNNGRSNDPSFHPHNLYMQNDFTKNYEFMHIENNLLLDAQNIHRNSFNLHAYGECRGCAPILQGFKVYNNILDGGRNIIGGYNEAVAYAHVHGNLIYNGPFALGYKRPTTYTFWGNYLGRSRLSIINQWGADEQNNRPHRLVTLGNTFAHSLGDIHLDLQVSGYDREGNPRVGIYDLHKEDRVFANKFYGPFIANFNFKDGGYRATSLEQWREVTRSFGNEYERGSRHSTDTAPNFVRVYHNVADRSRATIGIFNWNQVSMQGVDLSDVLDPGQSFQLIRPRDIHGEVVFEGQYDGKEVLIPVSPEQEFTIYLLLPSREGP